MQVRYRFFQGGDWNPYEKERSAAYGKLTEERMVADPNKVEPIWEVFPKLGSWADYVIANSKSVFWLMERDISINEVDKAEEIEDIWDEAKSTGAVGEWLMKSEAEESEKAVCYYIAALHRRFDPNDPAVDFRLYISEGNKLKDAEGGFTLEEYEY